MPNILYWIFGATIMSQLSKHPLNKDSEKRIYEIFTHVLAEASSQADMTHILYDFLTPTERDVVPKKLCIAYLLFKGFDQRAISHYLNVSFTTITKVSTALKNGGNGYKILIDRIQKQEAFNVFLETIESGIAGFVSSGSRKHAERGKIEHSVYKTPHTMASTTPDILPPRG